MLDTLPDEQLEDFLIQLTQVSVLLQFVRCVLVTVWLLSFATGA